MSSSTAMVSVVVPVHNSERYIAATLDSLAHQTLPPAEIIVVDDASTDGSAEIVSKMGFPRVRYLRHDINRGPAAARNAGIVVACGDLVAMLDSDDIAEPTRLARQVAEFQRRPDLACIGTWGRYIDPQGRVFGKVARMETDSTILPSLMLFRNRIFGSSIMFRRDRTPTGLYPDLRLGEDYAFAVAMLKIGRISNVPAPLLRIRRDGTSLTYAKQHLWKESVGHILADQLESLGIPFTLRELELHQHIGRKLLQPSLHLLNECEDWLLRLSNYNHCRKVYDAQIFDRVLGAEWFDLSKFSASIGPSVWKAFWSSPLARLAPPSVYEQAKLLAKCTLRRGRALGDVPQVREGRK